MSSIRYLTMKAEQLTLRPLHDAERAKALELAWKVFLVYESPDYSPEGTEAFRQCLTSASYLDGIVYYGAFLDGVMVGMTGIRTHNAHICFLFVDGDHHRKGIGSALLNLVKKDYPDRPITLNASPFSVAFYMASGFVATDQAKTMDGITFTPMTYTACRKD